MSRLVGEQGERWKLTDAVDALGESARSGGRIGWIWVAGYFYPSIAITGWVLGLGLALLERSTDVDFPAVEWDLGALASELPNSHWGIAILILSYRLAVGLAFVAGPEIWERCVAKNLGSRNPRLAEAWNRGRGVTLSAVGLWILVQFLTFAALLAVLGPVVILINAAGIEEPSLPLLVMLSPLGAVMLLYAAVLQIINQLALHSLACNRRGASSAMIHAWRLVRNEPWSVVRAGVVDLVLTVVTIAIYAAATAVSVVMCIFAPLLPFILISIRGFVGTTRAAYWARVYRALGGSIPADHMPGIETAEGW